MKHGASLLYSFILFVGDFIALVAAFSLAYVIRVKLDDRPLLEPITARGYIGVIAVLLIFWLIIFALLGLYRSQVYENRFKEFLMLLVGSFVGILFLIGSEYALNKAIFPARLVTIYGFLFAFLICLLFRTTARAIRRLLFRYGIGINNILIIGSTPITGELAKSLSQPHLGYRVIGIIADKRTKYDNIAPKIQFSNFAEAIKQINTRDIHSIVQTELFADQQRNDEILSFAQEHHIAYRFVPGNSGLFVGSIEVNLFEDIPTIAVHQTALIGWGRIVKRAFDVVFGALLLVLASPILLVTWLLLTFFGGDAVYKQTRVSRFNTKIGLYKFRTHKHDYHKLSPEEAFAKMGKPELAKKYRESGDLLENDPRVTKFGRFLRRTSIDELPQLINVIKGDISLVGPRPLVPEEINLFDKKSSILSVKPGITGLAVISGRRNIPFEERRRLDMYYVQHWSFWLDIVILLKTIAHVILRSFSRSDD
ncbi:sugar transferase [Candidatus Saccharibacteria bacterium]|nr:sugar transferase [Candidatus Saccharibacteria bacterium]MCA9346841.1 sugar transferase [Candidatus Saccharibacteria bacterium]